MDERNMNKSPSSRSERDALSRTMFASFIIMAGLIFLAQQMGMLPTFGDSTPWHWIMMGAGLLLVADSLIRSVSPEFASSGKRWLLGCILFFVGMSAIFGVDKDKLWPALLIVIGVGALMRSLERK